MLQNLKPKNLLVAVLALTTSVAVLFLIVYGSVVDRSALYTAGIGIINFAIGSIITYYFKQEENQELKASLEEWRKWYDNECSLEEVDENRS